MALEDDLALFSRTFGAPLCPGAVAQRLTTSPRPGLLDQKTKPSQLRTGQH